MTKNLKRNFLIILLLSFVMMVIILKNDYNQIIKLFSHINILIIIPIILMIIYNLVDAFFFKYCFSKKKEKYSLWEAIKVQQIGSFFNAIDPFSSGGQVAQTLLFKKQGVPYKESTSVLMLCFISYQTILVIFTTLLLLFAKGINPHFAVLILIIIGFAINIVVIVGLILATFFEKARDIVITKAFTILGKLKIIKNPEERIKSSIDWFISFENEFKMLINNKKLLVTRLTIDFVKLVIYFSITYFIALSLNLPIELNQFIYCFVLSSFTYIVSSIVPIPGSAGGAEASFVSLFYPLFSTSTTSVMLLWRLITCYLPMIIGFIVFANSSEFKEEKDK